MLAQFPAPLGGAPLRSLFGCGAVLVFARFLAPLRSRLLRFPFGCGWRLVARAVPRAPGWCLCSSLFGCGAVLVFAQFPAPLWGASGLFFGSVPVGILRPRSDALGRTSLLSC
ncbi:hypothetical protein AB852_13480 [Streptomyces uncialis]|uniref:Uncharacterized protein n=1 Tax=Streptomyces uncialis TaxID=1048205 RepID=A0A1Q4VBA6_9ACTN|nr:hypothetical protein AB852_13480 [Streptomyces uncialis]